MGRGPPQGGSEQGGPRAQPGPRAALPLSVSSGGGFQTAIRSPGAKGASCSGAAKLASSSPSCHLCFQVSIFFTRTRGPSQGRDISSDPSPSPLPRAAARSTVCPRLRSEAGRQRSRQRERDALHAALGAAWAPAGTASLPAGLLLGVHQQVLHPQELVIGDHQVPWGDVSPFTVLDSRSPAVYLLGI